MENFFKVINPKLEIKQENELKIIHLNINGMD